MCTFAPHFDRLATFLDLCSGVFASIQLPNHLSLYCHLTNEITGCKFQSNQWKSDLLCSLCSCFNFTPCVMNKLAWSNLGFAVLDQIFTLQQLLEPHYTYQLSTIIVFPDIHREFDSSDMSALCNRFVSCGVSKKCVRRRSVVSSYRRSVLSFRPDFAIFRLRHWNKMKLPYLLIISFCVFAIDNLVWSA